VTMFALGSLPGCGEISSARAFATEPGIALAAFGGADFAGADADGFDADAVDADVFGADAFDAGVFDADVFDAAACSSRRYQQ
jgi:hypothetical protein